MSEDRLLVVTKTYVENDMALFDAMWKSVEKEYGNEKIASLRFEEDRDVEILAQNNALIARVFKYCELDVANPDFESFDVTFIKMRGMDVVYVKFTNKKTLSFLKVQLERLDGNVVFSYGVGAYEFNSKNCEFSDAMVSMVLAFLHHSKDLRKTFFEFWIENCLREDCPVVCYRGSDDVPTVSFGMLCDFSFLVQHDNIRFSANDLIRDANARFDLTPEEFEAIGKYVPQGHAKSLIDIGEYREKIEHAIKKENKRCKNKLLLYKTRLSDLNREEWIENKAEKRNETATLLCAFFATKKPKLE